MYNDNFPYKRFNITLDFLQKHIEKNKLILDLGVENPFSLLIRDSGYKVNNTSGEDLDIDRSSIINSNAEVITAFEIFEHLLNPYNVLKDINTATVNKFSYDQYKKVLESIRKNKMVSVNERRFNNSFEMKPRRVKMKAG